MEVGGVLLALGVDYLVSGNDTDTETRASTGTGAGGSTPTRIRESVTRLGPNFVKIGQALASRPDLVGEAIAGELLLLQDAMPLFSNEVARRFIHEVCVFLSCFRHLQHRCALAENSRQVRCLSGRLDLLQDAVPKCY